MGAQVTRICQVATRSAGRSGSVMWQAVAAAVTCSVVIVVGVKGSRPGFGRACWAK